MAKTTLFSSQKLSVVKERRLADWLNWLSCGNVPPNMEDIYLVNHIPGIWLEASKHWNLIFSFIIFSQIEIVTDSQKGK